MKKKFLCFRPIFIETESESKGPKCFGDRAFTTCITVATNKKHPKISVVKPVLNSETPKCSKSSIYNSSSSIRPKSNKSQSFSGVVKAVLFEISLKKKAKIKKFPQLKSSDSRKSGLFSDISKSPKSVDSSFQKNKRNLSDNNKFVFDIHSSSLKEKKQSSKSENRVVGGLSSNWGLLWILAALSVTVFYGRICGITFSSLFLYLVPRRSVCGRKLENKALVSPETASDHRKRVIMEGLLERNHQRRWH